MHTPLFDASTFSLWWALPFVSFLTILTIAPLVGPNFWHRCEKKIIGAFCGLIIGCLLLKIGALPTAFVISDVIQGQYIPFVVLMSALFIVCGGIHISTKGSITPFGNVVFLFFGGILASIVGTTGASILLIRPFLNLNHDRHRKTYLVVFFIFMVSNIGGSLTPIGDAPLFLGFLKGVHFFWPLKNLWLPFLFVSVFLLSLFYIIDRRHYRLTASPIEEVIEPEDGEIHIHAFNIRGKRNILLLSLVLFVVVFSGMNLEKLRWFRDGILVGICLLSFFMTPKSIHHMNRFGFEPLKEVSFVFLAIFLTLIPIENMLHLGNDGAFRDITMLANPNGYPDPLRYYLLTGILSAFLDNAPTYLLFFHMAGGGPTALMTTEKITLLAISTASVFWGALTYIGNAPNLMVRAIASRMQIPMPGFLGYMAWSSALLLPVLLIMGLWFFR